MTIQADIINFNHIKEAAQKNWVLAGGISSVLAFFSDILQPLAPFATYLFLFSLLGIFILSVLFFVLKFYIPQLLPMFLFFILSLLISGTLSAFQQGEAEETGVLSEMIPGITALQQSLGLIQKQVEEIKEITENIDKKLDNITENFDKLGQQGGIIANPKTPEAFYHNARIYEINGDYGNARKAYLEYFKANLDYLDPHLRFQAFLKIQEGYIGAKESYYSIAEQHKTFITKYASALLEEKSIREQKLQQLMTENPEFAPVYYHLSQEYSLMRLGNQTLADKQKEQAYLLKFQQLDNQGKLIKYILDKEIISQWRQDTQNRLALLKATPLLENPVSINWMSSSSGWIGSISIAEASLEIFWKAQGDYKSTGHMQQNDPRTGQPMPNMNIVLPPHANAMTLQIKYLNANNQEIGPFSIDFEPVQAIDKNSKMALELSKYSWLSFRDYDGKTLLYFTPLMTYRGIISNIYYGLDRETPDQEFKFPAYQGNSMVAPITEEVRVYIEVAKKTAFATVKVVYKDGSETEIVKIMR